MARVKLSEYRAKRLLADTLGYTYTGHSVDLEQDAADIPVLADGQYVVKVDQAVKKRNTLGLVMLRRSPDEVATDLAEFAKQGFKHALVEPFEPHEQTDETFVALELTEQGVLVHFSKLGGVKVEEHAEVIEQQLITHDTTDIESITNLPTDLLKKLLYCFAENHMTYLEINPLVLNNDTVLPLDAAAEVDTAASFFVGGRWEEADHREPKKQQSESEKAIEELASKSPASFSLKVLNPDGSLFLLLSGGGASVVVADEVANLGYQTDIANYGEYSGNPNEEETYIYTTQLIKLLVASKAQKKVLLIAGGVANFTDVAQTFKGVIRAIEGSLEALKQEDLQIFVRRGGPNQKVGLATLRDFLNKVELKNEVHGPEVSLAAIVKKATEGLN